MRKRYTYKAHHVGRLRVAAAKLLTKYLDLDCRPEDISPATGAWRTDWRQDVYRWEVFTRTKTGIPFVMGCWWTLTDFVKQSKDGCHVHADEIYPGPEKPKA